LYYYIGVMNESSSSRFYDPDLLRTFLAVAQALSFTRAAERLSLSQPTVSQQIRKLEQATGRSLFVRDTRTVALTADGEILAGFARSILAANDQAIGYFTGSGLAGRLRLGVTDDLALTQVPRILREFRQLYPRVHLDLTVSQSEILRRKLDTGHLDLALLKMTAGPLDPRGHLVRRDRLVWTATPDTKLELDQPLPLVVYQAPSSSRSAAVQALDQVGTPYRVSCTVRGVNGVIAAVRAGLGITVMARSLLPRDFTELRAPGRLPQLGEIDVVLLHSPQKITAPVEAITATILASGRPLLEGKTV
jgi:DNA-binding transcriptional LysR family regulator